MRLLKVLIWCYVFGLLTFYVYALFGTKAWDIAYFAWAKVADCGILAWSVIYFNSEGVRKRMVQPLFIFSFVRLAADIQSYFTGVGVNNEFAVALIFLILIVVTGVLVFMRGTATPNFFNKHLNI